MQWTAMQHLHVGIRPPLATICEILEQFNDFLCSNAALSNTSISLPSRLFARTGEEPQKDGVTEKSFPSTNVQLRERWCPSNLQPQVESFAGVPKIEMKYKCLGLSGESQFFFRPWICRIFSCSSNASEESRRLSIFLTHCCCPWTDGWERFRSGPTN